MAKYSRTSAERNHGRSANHQHHRGVDADECPIVDRVRDVSPQHVERHVKQLEVDDADHDTDDQSHDQ